MNKNTRTICSLIALAAWLTVSLAGSSAFAAGPASPKVVEYQSAGILVIQLPDGTNYLAFASALNGCAAHSADTVKAWQSLAQSALLSGKNLVITSSPCVGNVPDATHPAINYNRITSLDLNQ